MTKKRSVKWIPAKHEYEPYALCEGKGWLCAVEMQRVTMLRHRTDMSRRGTVWNGMAKVP